MEKEVTHMSFEISEDLDLSDFSDIPSDGTGAEILLQKTLEPGEAFLDPVFNHLKDTLEEYHADKRVVLVAVSHDTEVAVKATFYLTDTEDE